MSEVNALFSSWLLAFFIAGLPQIVAWILFLRREKQIAHKTPEACLARFAARLGMTPEKYQLAVLRENNKILSRCRKEV